LKKPVGEHPDVTSEHGYPTGKNPKNTSCHKSRGFKRETFKMSKTSGLSFRIKKYVGGKRMTAHQRWAFKRQLGPPPRNVPLDHAEFSDGAMQA